MSNLPRYSAGISKVKTVQRVRSPTKAILTLQRKGVDWYNADCSLEIVWYAIPGKCIYNLWWN